MDPAAKENRAEDGTDPASDFVRSILSTLPERGHDASTRSAQRRWYESLSEQDQMLVRDMLREEIARIRAEFGKKRDVSSITALRLRDHG
ncbi:hypothetical protein [Pseudomonas abietaniphila]|uniref:hypothetical protein n=1 Tax=Pseudomonas abietaniphila TaxID=89065 RepID=UPI000784BDA2|nr:hypothetical protein [Pseudomonas abietaniphila]